MAPQIISIARALDFELVTLNSDYPTLSSENTPLMIIGTMIEHRKR
ncbi:MULTISPECIES: hypothetical protein [Proteus]|nr:hypothetical protein [Proteus sp. CD3]